MVVIKTILNFIICTLSGAVIWYILTQLDKQAKHRKWEEEKFNQITLHIYALRKELDIYKHIKLKKGYEE